ncbi:RNA polymerase sigma factor [Alteromonas sediminis]|nr:sigma-70 family RNA polymerase sigma factor [Alteromonas sediminis]
MVKKRIYDPTEEQALSQFLEKHQGKVMNCLHGYVDSARAEDIFQEAIIKIYQLAEQNPSDQDFFEKLNMLAPMLFTIAKNKAISELRHHKVTENYRHATETSATEYGGNMESSLIQDAESRQLLEAINALPPICRQVFVQRKLNGKSHAQIAEMLNISTKTVEAHIAKGLKLCRAYLLKQKADAQIHAKRQAG